VPDSGEATSPGPDAAFPLDAGKSDAGSPPSDAGPSFDGGSTTDSGERDAGVLPDAGVADTGTMSDAGLVADAGGVEDAGFDGLDSGSILDAGLEWGTPINAPPDTWTWVDFPNTFCNDGSPLGIGINPSTTSSNLLIYLNGGGACWDAVTCLVFKSATLGPYTPQQFASDVASIGNTTNRTDPLNPFQDWNYVFIPYCTGDVHAGDNVATYTLGTTSTPFHHVGHANFMAFLARLGPTFPAPGKLVVVGDSAGGAGATVNYAFAKEYWPNAEAYLINDSLPFYPPSETPAATMSSELTNWGVQPVLQSACGSACAADFSVVYPGLRKRFASDRMAYMGYEQDETMSAYYETLPILFQLYLNQLANQELHPSMVNTYFMNGTNHTMLWSWSTISTSQGVNLRDWVTQMVTDDPQWTSAGP
jgi:hypothetical protein